jgi:hypothetical protein
MFLKIGDIANEECTLDIYNTLSLALSFITDRTDDDEEMNEKIHQLYASQIFMSAKFTK